METIELEKAFKARCKKELPQLITVSGKSYKLTRGMFSGSKSRYEINYVEWDGMSCNWENVLIDEHFEVCEVMPKEKEREEHGLNDATIYVTDYEEIFVIAKRLLSEHNYSETDLVKPCPKPPFEAIVTSGYHHVVPDSQSFDQLEQILSYVTSKGNDDYLRIALENTIKNGYVLTNTKVDTDCCTCPYSQHNIINGKWICCTCQKPLLS